MSLKRDKERSNEIDDELIRWDCSFRDPFAPEIQWHGSLEFSHSAGIRAKLHSDESQASAAKLSDQEYHERFNKLARLDVLLDGKTPSTIVFPSSNISVHYGQVFSREMNLQALYLVVGNTPVQKEKWIKACSIRNHAVDAWMSHDIVSSHYKNKTKNRVKILVPRPFRMAGQIEDGTRIELESSADVSESGTYRREYLVSSISEARLKFKNPRNIQEAIQVVWQLEHYVSLLVGHYTGPSEIKLSDGKRRRDGKYLHPARFLKVYISRDYGKIKKIPALYEKNIHS